MPDMQLLPLMARIVAAHQSHNPVPTDDVPELIQTVYNALEEAVAPAPVVAVLQPAVPVRKSVFPSYIVCLEDGRKLKMLKRHLALYGLTPDQYRAKWRLPSTYPMVAPDYTKHQSTLARSLGLGRQISPRQPAEKVPVQTIPAGKRGRPRLKRDKQPETAG